MQDLPSAQWAQRMKVGDSINLAGQGGGYHVMIYIGTLRDLASPPSRWASSWPPIWTTR